MTTFYIYIDGAIKYAYNQDFDSLNVIDSQFPRWPRPMAVNLKYIAEMGKRKLQDNNDVDSGQRLIRAFMLRMAQELQSSEDITQYAGASISCDALDEEGNDTSVIRGVLREVFEDQVKVMSTF